MRISLIGEVNEMKQLYIALLHAKSRYRFYSRNLVSTTISGGRCLHHLKNLFLLEIRDHDGDVVHLTADKIFSIFPRGCVLGSLPSLLGKRGIVRRITRVSER